MVLPKGSAKAVETWPASTGPWEESSNQHRALVATENNHQDSHQDTRSNGERQQNTWGSHSRFPQKATDDGDGELVLERKVRDTWNSMPAGQMLKFQKRHKTTIPCHCNLHIKLIYKCKKKKKSPQEAGLQARGRKPMLCRIGRENRKTQIKLN